MPVWHFSREWLDELESIIRRQELYQGVTLGRTIRCHPADELLDASGQLRVIFRTPNWEEFVHLAFSEIRCCGANNLQVVSRLRAMIENLVQTLPAHRHASLLQQLALLDREIEKHFTYPEELPLARVADAQGLGGHPGTTH